MTKAVSEMLLFEVLSYTPYFSDLAPNDFHLSGPQKQHLASKRFSTNTEVLDAVYQWLRIQDEGLLSYWYSSNGQKMVHMHCKTKGDYIEKRAVIFYLYQTELLCNVFFVFSNLVII